MPGDDLKKIKAILYPIQVIGGGNADQPGIQSYTIVPLEDNPSIIENHTVKGFLSTLSEMEVGSSVSTFTFPTNPLFDNHNLSFGFFSGMMKGSVFLLPTYSLSSFNGVQLPSGWALKYANAHFKISSQTRFLTVFKGNKFFAWDAHTPVGNASHSYYHYNQSGTNSLFGIQNHASIPTSSIWQAKTLKVLHVGGRVFLIIGVAVDAARMGLAVNESIESESVRPVAAQTVRTAGSWAAAWAGSKAGFWIGGAVGLETGPGAALFAIGGAAIFGTAGYFGADWIADFIYED